MLDFELGNVSAGPVASRTAMLRRISLTAISFRPWPAHTAPIANTADENHCMNWVPLVPGLRRKYNPIIAISAPEKISTQSFRSGSSSKTEARFNNLVGFAVHGTLCAGSRLYLIATAIMGIQPSHSF